jgi:phospholipid/cholesterol/gamma-HCH transport system substrate-binding protein
MAPRLSWSKLVPGLIALTVLVVVVGGVLMFAGIGQIRGEKLHLYVLTNQARGVMRGTEVWIAGQKVGLVEDVDFRPPSNDSLGRLVVAISMRKRDADQIRRDSRAQVRAGASLIAPVVVFISTGSPGSPRVREGDTIQARAQSDLGLAGVKLTAAAAELAPIMTDARTVVSTVRSPRGTLGAFLSEGLGSDIGRLRAQVSRLRRRMGGDGGAAKQGMSAAMARARVAMARADSIRTLVASTNSSFGRFRRDSTLGSTVASVRDELTRLKQELAENDGTLARASSDSALTRSIAGAQREMAELFADIRRRPLRYVSF